MIETLIRLLLESTLIGIVVILCILILRFAFHFSLSAKVKYYIWVVALIALLIPVRIDIPAVSTVSEPIKQQTAETVMAFVNPPKHTAIMQPNQSGKKPPQNIKDPNKNVPNTIGQTNPVQTNPNESTNSVVQETAATTVAPISPWNIAFIVWAVGVLMYLAWIALGYMFFRKSLKDIRRLDDNDANAILDQCMGPLKIKKKISIYISDNISTPLLMGVFTSKILLPSTNYNENELRYILTHELIHFKRRDLWYKCLFVLTNAVHWFNPLVYFMHRKLNEDCELSCDERLIKGLNDEERNSYGNILLDNIYRQNGYQVNMTTAMNNSKRSLKKRLNEIVNYKAPKKFVFAISIIFVALIVCAAVFVNSFLNTNNTVPVSTTLGGLKCIYYDPSTTSYAILEDHSLWVWGDNQDGQVGDGTRKNRISPYKVMEDVKEVKGDFCNTYAIKLDGSLWGWGTNQNGELGDGSLKNKLSPIKIMDDVKLFTGCKKQFSQTGALFVIKNDNSLWAWGTNDGLYGDGGKKQSLVPLKIMTDVERIYEFKYCVFVIKNDQSLWGWGDNEYGDLGIGMKKGGKRPTKIMDQVREFCSAYDALKVSVIKTDGSLWSWGYSPIGTDKIQDKLINELNDVKSVQLVDNATFALRNDSTLWGWGINYDGFIGTGDKKDVLYPKLILNEVSKFYSGGTNYAVCKDHSIWAWGNNENGEIGDNSKKAALKPVKVFEDAIWFDTAAGAAFAIKSDHTLWTWGENIEGVLGNGSEQDVKFPSKITDQVKSVYSNFKFDEVDASYENLTVYAIKDDNSLWSWGSNVRYDVGNGSKITQKIPEKILEDVQILAFYDENGVIKNDGSLWVWGINQKQSKPTKIIFDDKPIFSNSPSPQGDDKVMQVAYKTFLNDLFKNKNSKDDIRFSIKDLDNNDIPELVILKNGVDITVYTFAGTVLEAGKHNFVTGTSRLLISDNSSYPGVFSFFESGGFNHYGYITIKDNKFTYEELWNEDYSGISKELGISREKIEDISYDKQLIKESKTVYKEKNELLFQELLRNNFLPILDSSTNLSAKDINNTMQKIDSRVKKVKESLNHELRKNYYDKDILVYRYFEHVFSKESFAGYALYYDEQGKLIYAEIAHYRAALYNIYFHNDELLHVEVGPFSYEGGSSINGDMANVKAVIKKDPSYAFVMEDISLCLEHAYK